MHQRMVDDHGFKFLPKRIQWRKAWDLHIDPPAAKSDDKQADPVGTETEESPSP